METPKTKTPKCFLAMSGLIHKHGAMQ